jgi:hypothetical protein
VRWIMSPINFDILQSEYPEFEAVWPMLRTWFDKNWRKRYVELSVLLRALPQLDRLDLVLAIQAMIDRGMLATAYKVKSPGGDLLEGEFDQPDKVPPRLPDRDYSRYINTDEADIVSGYRWEPVGAA